MILIKIYIVETFLFPQNVSVSVNGLRGSYSKQACRCIVQIKPCGGTRVRGGSGVASPLVAGNPAVEKLHCYPAGDARCSTLHDRQQLTARPFNPHVSFCGVEFLHAAPLVLRSYLL